MLFKNKSFLTIFALSMIYLALFTFISLTSQSVYNSGFWCGFTFTGISIILVFTMLTMRFVINRQEKAKVAIMPTILTSVIYLFIQLTIGIVAIILNSENNTILLVLQILFLVGYSLIMYGLYDFQSRYIKSNLENNYKKLILKLTERILIENKNDNVAEIFGNIKGVARYIDAEASEDTEKYYQEILELLQNTIDKLEATKEEDILKVADRVLQLLKYINI